MSISHPWNSFQVPHPKGAVCSLDPDSTHSSPWQLEAAAAHRDLRCGSSEAPDRHRHSLGAPTAGLHCTCQGSHCELKAQSQAVSGKTVLSVLKQININVSMPSPPLLPFTTGLSGGHHFLTVICETWIFRNKTLVAMFHKSFSVSLRINFKN